MKTKIQEIGKRAVMFTFYPLDRWALNCYVVFGETQSYIIDTGCGSNDVKIMVEYILLREKNLPIAMINTHYHWDHIWGNGYLDGINIYASTACKMQIEQRFDSMLNENAEYINGEVRLALPNVTFSDKLDIFDDQLFMFVSLGHTVDGICIYDKKDKILFVGDNVGDNEIEVVPELECSVLQYKKALSQMKELDFNLLASGHNRLLPKSFLDRILQQLDLF